jgi:hypothetical protein
MTFPQEWRWCWLVVYLVVFTLAAVQQAAPFSAPLKRGIGWSGLFIWIFGSVVIFGFRDDQLGVDTGVYLRHAEMLAAGEAFDPAFELGYNVLVAAIVQFCSPVFALPVINLLFVVLLVAASWLLLGEKRILIGLIGLGSTFVYYGMSYNVIRSGLAIALWLVGVALLFMHSRWAAAIVFFVIAAFVHRFSVAFSLIAVISFMLPIVPSLAPAVFASTVVAAVQLNFAPLLYTLMQRVAGGYALKYAESGEYRIGWRWDFAVYGISLLALMTAVASNWSSQILVGDRVKKLMVLDGILFAMFIVAFLFPYSDRVGAPFLILVPLIFALLARSAVYFTACLAHLGFCFYYFNRLGLLIPHAH